MLLMSHCLVHCILMVTEVKMMTEREKKVKEQLGGFKLILI